MSGEPAHLIHLVRAVECREFAVRNTPPEAWPFAVRAGLGSSSGTVEVRWDTFLIIISSRYQRVS
jgi:hypothetical protein